MTDMMVGVFIYLHSVDCGMLICEVLSIDRHRLMDPYNRRHISTLISFLIEILNNIK